MTDQAGTPGDFGTGFEADFQTGLQSYTFANRVFGRMEEIGLSKKQQPTLSEEHKGIFPGQEPGSYFEGGLPSVIRSLTLDQISALYSLFSNWYSYLMFQYQFVGVERSEAKRQKEFLWSHLRKQHKFDPDGKKNSDQAASDLTRIDYRFIEADAKYEELNLLYNYLEALCKITEQDMKVISREVTIHQAKMEHDSYNRNMEHRMGEGNWGRPAEGDQHAPSNPPQRPGTPTNKPRGRFILPKKA